MIELSSLAAATAAVEQGQGGEAGAYQWETRL